MEDMMNMKVFLEKKKKKYWATWEEKKKDLVAYLSKISLKLKCEKPDPSLKKEKHLLKAIIDELRDDEDEERKKMKVLQEAFFTPLKEIYKMPGCIDELIEMLKSHPTIGLYETDMITDAWYKQYDHDARELKNSSSYSTSEQEIQEREEFLTRKCVEIDKAKDKVKQMSPEIWKVLDLLLWANISSLLVSKVPDNYKDRSSSSREDCSSSSRLHKRSTSSREEDCSSSSRLHKRSRKQCYKS